MVGRPLQIVITFKSLLLAVALFLLTWAVVSIRDTLVVVFVGIFLGLVFEGPVRLVERKTRLGRGMSATVTVIGALVVVTLLGLVLLKPLLEGMQSFLKDLPQTVDQLKKSSELGFLRTRAPPTPSRRARRASRTRFPTRSGRSSGSPGRPHPRVLDTLPDHVHLPLLPLRSR